MGPYWGVHPHWCQTSCVRNLVQPDLRNTALRSVNAKLLVLAEHRFYEFSTEKNNCGAASSLRRS